MVTFTPNSDRVFSQWDCSPPSHIASGDYSAATGVFITQNTTLTASTNAKNCSVNVTWDGTRGSVNDSRSGSLVLTGDYRTTVSLTAAPDSGYYTEWTGYISGGYAGGPGQRYENAVNFQLTGQGHLLRAQWQAVTNPPNNPTKTISVSMAGGSGTVFSAGDASGSYSAGGWPYSSATSWGRFEHKIVPDPGYFFNYHQWVSGGATWYYSAQSMERLIYTESQAYTGVLTKGLTINVEVEGQGVVTSPQFTRYYNPLPVTYVGTPSTTAPALLPTANLVTMTPAACTGWVFDHWEYKTNGDYIDYPNPIPGWPQAFSVYMNWHPGSGIRVPNGVNTFTAKAVFRQNAYPVNFTFTKSGTSGGRCGETPCSGLEGTLYVEINWESSTGNMSDLAGGKVVEVICYDPSVTQVQVEECIRGKYAEIMEYPGSQPQRQCGTSIYAGFSPPWNSVMQSQMSYFSWAAAQGNQGQTPGAITDGHSFSGNCVPLTCVSGSYTKRQFLVWLDPSGECNSRVVSGPHSIVSTAHGDKLSVTVSMEGMEQTQSCSVCSTCSCS